jgi:hypothetical protein
VSGIYTGLPSGSHARFVCGDCEDLDMSVMLYIMKIASMTMMSAMSMVYSMTVHDGLADWC